MEKGSRQLSQQHNNNKELHYFAFDRGLAKSCGQLQGPPKQLPHFPNKNEITFFYKNYVVHNRPKVVQNEPKPTASVEEKYTSVLS